MNNLDNPSLWTDVETQILKDLWGTGVTAREIGAALKRSRGSVIGRANRIGMSKTAPKKLSLVSVEPTPKGKITAGCQFPLGAPSLSWCGADTVRGASTDVYCEAHYRKCYRERIGVSDRFELEPGGRYFRPLEEKQRKLTRALICGLFSVLFLFLAPAVMAGGHPKRFKLLLPCFPTAAWVVVVRENNFQPVDSRTDDDGDTWTIWETVDGVVWRGTLTIANGATTCVVGGRRGKKPSQTHF
jgi:hypothetical protein